MLTHFKLRSHKLIHSIRQTLLDTSSQEQISELADIELSRDEDSVTSLAVAHRTAERRALALAGINSSVSSQKENKNEHLRSFAMALPNKDALGKQQDNKASIMAVSQKSLFSPTSSSIKETYQRVLRLSRLQKRGTHSRLAAIATGLAEQGEVVLFDPDTMAVRSRIDLGKGEEAADIDMIERAPGEFNVCYCTDYEVSLYKVGGSGKSASDASSEPRPIWITPHPDVFAPTKSRPTFRALRFLTPLHVLLLSNRPGRSGAGLTIVEIGEGMGEIITGKLLHPGMKAATGLDVALLSGVGNKKQIVVAVAGQDISIQLFFVDVDSSGDLGKLRPYCLLPNVHPLQMTRICLSNFIAPADANSAPAQYLKLASVSMGNTVVVHTLPLTLVSVGSKKARHVLAAPSQSPKMSLSVIFSLFFVILVAILVQGFLEIRGGSPPYLQAANYLSPGVRAWLEKPYVLDSKTTIVSTGALPTATAGSLRDVSSRNLGNAGQAGRVVIKDAQERISVHVQGEVSTAEGKPWEELEDHEKHYWRQKLMDAGEWTAEEGETVLKGVLFGEMAGIVGQAMRG